VCVRDLHEEVLFIYIQVIRGIGSGLPNLEFHRYDTNFQCEFTLEF
jgi:hypothetical protein